MRPRVGEKEGGGDVLGVRAGSMKRPREGGGAKEGPRFSQNHLHLTDLTSLLETWALQAEARELLKV